MKHSLSRYFDFKIGVAGALVMGIAVFCINFFSTDLIIQSLFAALKQGVYTFFFGGSLMKGCEFIATLFKNDLLSVLLAIIIPSMVTLLLTYCLHSMKGTPKPLESIVPTLAIVPATAFWAIKKRRRLNISKDSPF